MAENKVEEAIKAAKEKEEKVKAEAEEKATDKAEKKATEKAENDKAAGQEAAAGGDAKAEENTAANDAAEEKEADSKGAKEKKEGFFKKKKDERDTLIEELQDKVKRQMAEFDNFRKRTDKEKSQMYEIGAKSIVEKILPVLDNFERGLTTVGDDKKDDPFVGGMDMIYKQLVTSLEEAGLKEIECLNQEFNPEFHNAVMHVEDENLGENIVVEVFQKGYTYKDSVVRHSMVKVAN